MKNYYEILKVDKKAPQEVIHAAYRTLMGKLKKHPDLGGDEEEAKLINQAYQVLRDPRSRSDYDNLASGGKNAPQEAGIERRRATRRPSSAVISFCFKHDYRWHSAMLRDISELGVKFKSHQPLIKGQEVTIAWTNNACQAVKGIVKWSRMFHPTVFERVYEAGVEFEQPVVDIDNYVMT